MAHDWNRTGLLGVVFFVGIGVTLLIESATPIRFGCLPALIIPIIPVWLVRGYLEKMDKEGKTVWFIKNKPKT